MTDCSRHRPHLRHWHAQDDGWALLASLFSALGTDGATWEIIDNLVENKEFEGLWWW
ncbi:MAG: hypothetical protein AAFQ54_14965 [Pseudomonadota bacterium]